MVVQRTLESLSSAGMSKQEPHHALCTNGSTGAAISERLTEGAGE
jgi:hypothetical protein